MVGSLTTKERFLFVPETPQFHVYHIWDGSTIVINIILFWNYYFCKIYIGLTLLLQEEERVFNFLYSSLLWTSLKMSKVIRFERNVPNSTLIDKMKVLFFYFPLSNLVLWHLVCALSHISNAIKPNLTEEIKRQHFHCVHQFWIWYTPFKSYIFNLVHIDENRLLKYEFLSSWRIKDEPI